MDEIEAKFKISRKQVVLLKKQLKKYFCYSRLEVNEFFDTKKHKLDKRGEVLRLRIWSYDDPYYIGATIAFKGKPIKSKFKNRPEYETEVEEPEKIRLLFKALGYNRYFLFEKQRENYRFENCSVEIDLLPELGYFCEIEGENEKIIEQVIKHLKLEKEKIIKDGYGMLMWKYAKKHHIDKEVRFK